jgi:outer membrane protein assembly factor BamB
VAAFGAVNATACVPYVPPAKLGPLRQESAWPAYLGTPRHDACAAESLAADPRPLWTTDVGRAVRGSPALGETVLVIGAADRTVALVDRATGQALWRTRLGGTIHGGPLLEGDRIYVATEATPDAKVYALRLRDGQPIWSTPTESVVAPLALDGDTLYAATETGLVLRLEAEGGRVTWRRRLPGAAAVRAGPVPTPAGIAVATTGDSLFLLDRASGAVQGRLALRAAVVATPALDGNRLYLGTTGGRLLAVELPALTVAWDLAAGDAVLGAPVVARDTVYAVARNGTLWIVPADHAARARSVALDLTVTAGPMPIASGVLVVSVSGDVVLVDRATGAAVWRVQLDGPIEQPPLVRDHQLVVIAGRGDIHSYR